MNRRQMLVRTSSAIGVSMAYPFAWTGSAHAEPVTAMAIATTGLKIGEMVTGMLGGRSAARAAALDKAATREMLTGISTAVDGIAEGLSTLVEQVSELPDQIQNLLLTHRSENNRASVLSTYRRFLQRRDDLLREGSNIGSNEETIDRYLISLWAWLDDVRHQAGIIFEIPDYDRIEPSLIMCICLRAELDIANELEGFGFDALSTGSLLQYRQYFTETITALDRRVDVLKIEHQTAERSGNEYIQLAADNLGIAMIHDREYAEFAHFPPVIKVGEEIEYNVGYIEIIAIEKPLTSYVSYIDLVDQELQTCVYGITPRSDNIREFHDIPFISTGYLAAFCDLQTSVIMGPYNGSGLPMNTTRNFFGKQDADPEIAASYNFVPTYDQVIGAYKSNQAERDQVGYILSSFLAAKDACSTALNLAEIAVDAANFQLFVRAE